MRQYEMYEMEFSAELPVQSDVEVNLQAVFTNGEEKKVIKGFYKGNGIYAIRFLPQTEGMYRYSVSGIVTRTGEVFCEANPGKNGMIQAEDTHFIYEGGALFYPFGTTVYALAHQPETLIEETLESLASGPFNKVRCCIFPKSYDYNHNDPDFYPFEKKKDGSWDVHHPSFAFWDHFESLILRMQAMGIQTDLILFHSYDRWGFTRLSLDEWMVYLDYVLRRLSAIPSIWWSMANEYDFIFNHSNEEWFAIENFIAQNDPYGHLLSNHNGMKLYDFGREAVTHCSIQTNAVHMVDEWQKRYGKPVVVDEMCYEGNIQHDWGNISAFEMTNRFWKVMAKGGYATHGETYRAEDEVLWWAKGGRLKGESPKRIAFLKEIVERLPGPIEPWDEPFFEDFFNPTELTKPGETPGFLKLLLSLPEEEKANLGWKSARYTGHIGKEVFIRFFGETCPAECVIHLPSENIYCVELIDTWNMTRKILISGVSGKTKLHLPGKEGMVVICSKISGEV